MDEVNPIPERNIIFITLYMYHVIYLKFHSYNDIWEKNTGISPFLLLHHIHNEIVLFRCLLVRFSGGVHSYSTWRALGMAKTVTCVP